MKMMLRSLKCYLRSVASYYHRPKGITVAPDPELINAYCQAYFMQIEATVNKLTAVCTIFVFMMFCILIATHSVND